MEYIQYAHTMELISGQPSERLLHYSPQAEATGLALSLSSAGCGRDGGTDATFTGTGKTSTGIIKN